MLVDRVTWKSRLENISDWLTKILVGVGLTEYREIIDHLQKLITYLSKGFEHSPAPEATVTGVITLFGIIGFLLGWLSTRLHLGRSMAEADYASMSKKVDDLASKQTKIEESMTKQIADLTSRQEGVEKKDFT